MRHAADFHDVLLEEAERVRHRKHQARDVLIEQRSQRVHVHGAACAGRHFDCGVTAHGGRGRIRAVGRIGNDHLAARISLLDVVCPDHEHAAEFAVGARGRLQRTVGVTGNLHKRLGEIVHEGECTLNRALRLMWMDERKAR